MKKEDSIESAQELLQVVELSGVSFIELEAKKVPRQSDVMEFGIQLGTRVDEGAFYFAFRLNAAQEFANYLVAVECRYDTKIDATTIPKKVSIEFVERVAIMAAYPFLRQGIASLAAMLELPVPILGLLRGGTFKINDDDDSEGSPAAIE